MKSPLIILGALAVAVGMYFLLGTNQSNEGRVTDYKDATYYISGNPVRLGQGGVTYFGNEVTGDLDKDGDLDIAFLITHEPGGSGTFFFLAGAIKEEGGYRGTQAMLIGDRIAPQTTEFRDGLVLINYADRLPLEPMTAKPSQGKSLYAKYSPDTNDFGEVVQNFEGESASGR